MWIVYDAFPAPDYYPRSHKGYAGVGPLPCKRWVTHPDDPKHKLSYKFRPTRHGHEAARDTAERVAIAYAEWLARRDQIKLRPDIRPRAIWDGFHSAFEKSNPLKGRAPWLNRISAVRFGDTVVQIPNWDFEHPPIEQCEQLALAA